MSFVVEGMPAANRILVIQLRQVGDLLCTTPLIRALRVAYPRASIELLVEPYAAVAAPNIPTIDKTKVVVRQPGVRGYLALRRTLREAGYDLVVDAQSNSKTAMFSWFTGAAVRVGFWQPWFRPHTRLGYTVIVPRRTGAVHSVDYRLDLLRAVAIPTDGATLDFVPSVAARREVEAFWRSRGLEGAAVVGLSPFARKRVCDWDDARWLEAGRGLRERGYRLLVINGPAERDRARCMASGLGEGTVVEEVSSYEAHGALFERCRALVMIEGGNVHLAAALGVPTVTLYGATSPEVWAPADHDRHRILLGACERGQRHQCRCAVPAPCMRDITVERVLECFDSLVGKGLSPFSVESNGAA